MSISRVQLIQELFTLKLMSRSRTTSNWDILGLHGKERRYLFKWNWFHVQIHLEAMGIIKIIGRAESVLVMRRRFWPLGRLSCLVH
jgi:hypothetical protein